MKALYKLDLEPNEIYNVSLNIKQGNKTVDNLRFFQTKVPKLFNIKPSNFSTYSQIIEQPDPVVKTESGGGLSGGGTVPLNVTSVSWTETKTGDFSEGELNSEPSQVTYNFKINLSGTPTMMGYQLYGFAGELSFLNYRNDYKPSGTSLTLSLTLSQIDPTAAASIINSETKTNYGLASVVKIGATRIELTGNLKGIVPGNTMVSTQQGAGIGGLFVPPAYVTGYTPGTQFVTVSKPAVKIGTVGRQIYFTSNAKFNGFTGAIYSYLRGGGEASSSTGLVKDATFVYQTFPTYSAPSYTYQFGQNSFIKSSVINPNVLESLVWEDEVRDFIFFVIADDTQLSRKYFFGTYGSITPAKIDAALTGTNLFSSSGPPSAPSDVTTSSVKSFTLSTPKIKFYDSGAVTELSSVAPELKRKIEVRFAVARYTKTSSGWTGQWLGAKKGAPLESDILSSPEVLE